MSAPAESREDQPVRLVEIGRQGRDPEPAAHLPIAPTPLIGRASDVASVAAMLSGAGGRLVTLVGPGGVGKTRLVLEIARSMAGELHDGAAIVRHAIADLARERGDRTEATARYRENLAVYRGLGAAAGIADSLTGMALGLADGAGLERAVRVLAAAAAIRDGLGATVHVGLRNADAALLARARSELREAVFAVAWQAGKGLPLDQVVAEADAALHGAQRSPTAAVDRVPTPPSPGGGHGLTPREVEVLRLVAAGMTDRQIGEALFVSHSTARTHVGRVLGKLGLNTRAAAAAYAHRHGLA